MGRFSDYTKQRGFLPLELNEDNVNTIYKRCLPTENTPSESIIGNYLTSKKNGFKEDSTPFYFDYNKLNKEFKNIEYLLGQLYDVHHTKDGYLYLKNFTKNYKDLPWFSMNSSPEDVEQTICKLIALGATVRDEKGIGTISSLIKDVDGCADIDLYPTLSPKDPDFKEWSQSEEGKKILARFQD